MRHEIAAHERAAHEIAAHERAVHERAAHHRAGPLESPPQGAHQVCPLPPIERTMQFSPISGGELMADPLLKFPPRSLAGEHFNQPLNFGCLDISSRAAEKTKKTEGNPPLPRIPSVQNMLDESRILGRVASGDPKAPDFQIREVSEHEFKQSYVRELLRLKARRLQTCLILSWHALQKTSTRWKTLTVLLTLKRVLLSNMPTPKSRMPIKRYGAIIFTPPQVELAIVR